MSTYHAIIGGLFLLTDIYQFMFSDNYHDKCDEPMRECEDEYAEKNMTKDG